MATVKGVIFANREAFNGKHGAVFNYYKANISNFGNATKWCDGIDSTNSNEVLMIVDERLDGFPWSPEQIVDVDVEDEKWFPNVLIP